MKKHLPLLQIVQSAKPKLRKTIISNSDLDFIKTLNDCVNNILAGNFILTDSEKQDLKKFKTTLRKISKSKGGLKEKKKIIVQTGGAFLPTLLAPIVAAGIAQFLNKK